MYVLLGMSVLTLTVVSVSLTLKRGKVDFPSGVTFSPVFSVILG